MPPRPRRPTRALARRAFTELGFLVTRYIIDLGPKAPTEHTDHSPFISRSIYAV